MAIIFDVDYQIADTSTLLKGLGLEPSGKVQTFFTGEVMRLSDPRVPYRDGYLASSARIAPTQDAITYTMPYARYHWYGMLMIGTAPKELTDIPMDYYGSPMRGPLWVDRTWIEQGAEIIEATENYIVKVSELK